ncbi:hypothetical protein MASR2M48_09950 [Spirochaetota bacterium]
MPDASNAMVTPKFHRANDGTNAIRRWRLFLTISVLISADQGRARRIVPAVLLKSDILFLY